MHHYNSTSFSSPPSFSLLSSNGNKNGNNDGNSNGSDNIVIPLGIVSLPGNVTLPSTSNQNFLISALDGHFGIFGENGNSGNSGNSGNNGEGNNKGGDAPPLRFLVFSAVHLSVTSILPLILAYNTAIINNNNKEKSTRESGLKHDKITAKNGLIDADIPPLSALFSRDLCHDLLLAVSHCIDW